MNEDDKALLAISDGLVVAGRQAACILAEDPSGDIGTVQLFELCHTCDMLVLLCTALRLSLVQTTNNSTSLGPINRAPDQFIRKLQ